MAECSQGVMVDVTMDLETPKKAASPEPTTPRRSERKRALFPSASPQTSDLGHMSPLGSSPDRFSSAPPSPDSATFSPIKKPSGPISPFGRRATVARIENKSSPRKQFSLLFANSFKDKLSKHTGMEKITPIIPKENEKNRQSLRSAEKPNDIVPADLLEQTVLSVMDESDCPESPLSEFTPGTTPQNKDVFRDVLDVSASQPLTPSKRRSMPVSGSGSVTSTSPHSPERKRRFSLESRSKSAGAELPRARTSLFSGSSRSAGAKRARDDGIYLTGRSTKRRKMYGEINAGVRTGIRRPPKSKPKSSSSANKKQGKVKSVWDVAPKSTAKKRSLSPIKLPKMSLLAEPVQRSDEEVAAFSASGSLQVRARRSNAKNQTVVSEPETEEEEETEPEPDPNRRIFKGKAHRTATVTLFKNVRIKIHKGKFSVDKDPAPPAKRRRKLYSLDKQIQAIKAFDDNEEDVAASTRNEVQNILQKLENDKINSPEALPPKPAVVSTGPLESTSVVTQEETDADPVISPARLNASSLGSFMSPLSQLASSTSTLSINVGGDTLHLSQAHVQALSAVPDVVMEDDDLPLCEPLPEENNVTAGSSDAKENENCNLNESETTPVKYFPIFSTNFSHQKAPVSPTVAKRKRSLLRAIGNDQNQYQLDAGQKRFGATECSTCSAIYQMGEPEDERAHQEFHDSVKDLKFMGWKNEYVVGEYGRNRVVAVRPGDLKSWWTKALDVLKVVDKDLGFAESVVCDPDHSMVYLYISDRSVIGCLLAVPVQKAHKMIETAAEAEGIDCCTAEEYPVKCGVSRIWVHRPHRKGGVGRQLMDCMRKNFMFGHILSLEEIAFSSPTVMGKVFAEHYTGRKDYYVYTQI